MIIPGSGDWKYIKAEQPCRKGELRASFYWWHLVLGWQKNSDAPERVNCNVSAISAEDIMLRSKDIAAAVSKELVGGNHRIQYAIKNLVHPS